MCIAIERQRLYLAVYVECYADADLCTPCAQPAYCIARMRVTLKRLNEAAMEAEAAERQFSRVGLAKFELEPSCLYDDRGWNEFAAWDEVRRTASNAFIRDGAIELEAHIAVLEVNNPRASTAMPKTSAWKFW